MKRVFFKNLFVGDFYDGGNTNQCPRACDYMDITFGYPSIYEVTNISSPSVTMYFKTSIPVRESQYAYPRSSLFAEIGGYTGLLLGFSLLDFTKVVKICSQKMIKVRSLVIKKKKVDPEEDQIGG